MADLTTLPRPVRRALPWAFALVGVLAVLAVWMAGESTEQRVIREDTRLTAEQVRLRLEAWVDNRVAAVRLFVGRHDARRHASLEYDRAARRLLELFPGFQALNFIDASGVIRDVVPDEGNEAALGRNVYDHKPGVGRAVDRTRASGGLAFGPVIELFQGGRGVTAYQAVHGPEGEVEGFVNAVFRIDTLVDACLAEQSLRRNYRFRIIAPSGVEVYRHADDGDPAWPHAYTTHLRIFGRGWRMELAPSTELLEASASLADEISAAVGVLLVLLISLLLRAHIGGLETLAESQARYRLLVENASDMIVKVDAAGRFTYVSPSYCRTFGKTEDELLGRGFMPLVHEDDREATAREMAKLEQPPHTCHIEQRALTARGWRWLAWSDTALLGPDGRIEAVIGVGQDISARKELEDQLRQAQKLQAVGQLAGGIAHDFNNILQAVLGNLHFAQEELPEGHPALTELEPVQQGAERAAQLTRQLLAFSRQQVLSRELLDVDSLVRDHLRLLRRLIGEGIALEFRPGPEVGLVSADPAQLEQILLNLCVNARDAIGSRGTIEIGTGGTVVDAPRPDDPGVAPGPYVTISVRDDGTGMEPAVVERIFDPFFTTKGVGRGTGLGLATAYGIVRQHGGFIEVQSEPGVGSTFVVCLPRAEGEVEERETGAPAAPGRGHETVLLAEDDDAVRDFAERALGRAGYRVLTARDGEEAVAVAERHAAEIGLVLLDVVMPRLGGPEAARRIRALIPGVALVFASGYAPDEAVAGLPAGEEPEFLAKPYRLHDLLRAVRDGLDRA